jgi:hypothetical protein
VEITLRRPSIFVSDGCAGYLQIGPEAIIRIDAGEIKTVKVKPGMHNVVISDSDDRVGMVTDVFFKPGCKYVINISLAGPGSRYVILKKR